MNDTYVRVYEGQSIYFNPFNISIEANKCNLISNLTLKSLIKYQKYQKLQVFYCAKAF